MGSDYHEIEAQAARWIDRMSRPVQDSELAAEFDRWILKDPRHVESYARVSAIWQSDGLAAALGDAGDRAVASDNDDDMPRPTGRIGRLLTLRPVAGLVAVAACAMLAFFLSPPMLIHDESFATSRGETRTVALADGSTVRMNGATRLTVRLTPWSRHVTLADGEAFFDIAHERVRGFSVDAGGASISVLGTAFDVDRVGRDTQVVQVYRGLVSVDAGAGRRWRLPAGSGLEIAGERVRSLRGVAGERPGWIQGWYEANETPVAQLVQRLNRSSRQPINLSDPALGELLVTGRFQTDRPADVLDAIAAIHDLRWRVDGGHYILSR